LPVVSTQELPHCVSVPQPLAQVPAEHTMPLAQAWPHEPQFAASDVVSVQVPEHDVCPLRQPHTPALHTWPAVQALPQLPQFLASLWRLVHAPLHDVVPPEQPPGEDAPAEEVLDLLPAALVPLEELAPFPPDVAEVDPLGVASPGGPAVWAEQLAVSTQAAQTMSNAAKLRTPTRRFTGTPLGRLVRQTYEPQ
jgi:hypothetical protein